VDSWYRLPAVGIGNILALRPMDYGIMVPFSGLAEFAICRFFLASTDSNEHNTADIGGIS